MSLIFTVKQQNCAIIERFGKYHRIAKSGLHFKIPIVDRICTKLTLKIQQLNVSVETKTKDNVFVNLVVAVQYRVLPDKVYEACYMLQDPEQQIKAFVFDLVRAQVPLLDLDDVFSKKDDIAIAVKNELEGQMAEFGYGIIKALVVDLDSDLPETRLKEEQLRREEERLRERELKVRAELTARQNELLAKEEALKNLEAKLSSQNNLNN